MSLRRREQRAPHTEPSHRIIGFRLREQPLRFGDFRHAGESALIPSARLTLASRRRLPLNRRIPSNIGRRLHERARFDLLGRQRLNRSLVVRTLRQLVL